MNDRKKSKTVFVAGATGYLGGFVVKELLSKNYSVKALSRSKGKEDSIEALVDEVVLGDARDIESLRGSMKGVDVLISSVGIRSMNAKPTYEEVDFQANKNLVDLAREESVKHIIFVSVLMADKLRDEVPGMDARERVVDAIKDSGIKYTIARPNGFFNDMAGMFATAVSGRFILIGKGDTRINPIHGADLARELVDSIENQERWNHEFDIGGPEVYTLKEIGDFAFDALSRKRRFLFLPPALLEFFSKVCKPFNLNAAYLFKAMAILGSQRDMLAPRYGSHSLRDYFNELATDVFEKIAEKGKK